jgi:hypothetical protein
MWGCMCLLGRADCVFLLSASTAVCAAVSCQQLLLLLLLLLLQQCALCMYEATTAVMDLPILNQLYCYCSGVLCSVVLYALGLCTG